MPDIFSLLNFNFNVSVDILLYASGGAVFLFIALKVVLAVLKKGPEERIIEDQVTLEVRVPKAVEDSDRDTQTSSFYVEGMFAALHGLLKENSSLQEHFSLEIAFTDNLGIRFFVTAPANVIKFVESQVYAQYPKASMTVVEDYTSSIPNDNEFKVVNLIPVKEDFIPIKTFRDFEVDPLSAITSSLSEIVSGEQVWFQLVLMPVADGWQDTGHYYVERMRAGEPFKKSTGISFNKLVAGAGSLLNVILKELMNFFTDMLMQFFNPPKEDSYSKGSDKEAPVKLTTPQELEVEAIENKLSKLGFRAQMRIVSSAGNRERVDSNCRSFVAAFNQFYSSHTNRFTPVEDSVELGIDKYKDRSLETNKSHVMSVEELATIYHFPSGNLGTPNISWVHSRKSEPPAELPVDDCTYIGETVFRDRKVRFGLKNGDDRLRHMYLIGKSGTGKSTLLENMAMQDIKNGFGVGILDPHGETVDKVLDRIPDERIEDVVVVDPSDSEKPVGLNLLEMQDLSQKNLMASALISAIKQHFDYSWGPRLEYLLNYAVLTLLEVPGTTMIGITRLLEDQNYQNYILSFVKDPMILKFWNDEFKAMKGNQKLVTEAIAPIQNKVNRFLASSTIRNILGQRNSTVDIWDIMNSSKILLMNLSKGKVGDDNANLLGALLVSRIQFMALQRAKIPYEDRVPFYLYVDEFQNFATGSFETILSESRKYKLGLYLTHQYTAQLPEELLEAVFGNVGTIASFALGAPDAKELAHEFAPYFDETDIISQERFNIYIKLMIDGMTSLPFSAKILLPWNPETCVVAKTPNKEKALQRSREKYGVEREYVESKIAKWLETRFDKGMAIAEQQREAKAIKEKAKEAAAKIEAEVIVDKVLEEEK